MLKIEILSRNHDRSIFDCGNEELNRFLKNTAHQHLRKGLSKTFVIIDDNNCNEILGFYTLSFCEIRAEKLPQKYAKKYPSRVPAAKLARLAVSKKRQRRGLGALIMIDAIKRVITVSEQLGIIGFFVDAKHTAAKKYYLQYGFIELPNNLFELFLPLSMLRDTYNNTYSSATT